MKDLRYWISDHKEFLILGVLMLAVVGGGLFASFQPYCTTFSSGETVCSQLEWGGKRIWRE